MIKAARGLYGIARRETKRKFEGRPRCHCNPARETKPDGAREYHFPHHRPALSPSPHLQSSTRYLLEPEC